MQDIDASGRTADVDEPDLFSRLEKPYAVMGRMWKVQILESNLGPFCFSTIVI